MQPTGKGRARLTSFDLSDGTFPLSDTPLFPIIEQVGQPPETAFLSGEKQDAEGEILTRLERKPTMVDTRFNTLPSEPSPEEADVMEDVYESICLILWQAPRQGEMWLEELVEKLKTMGHGENAA